LWGLVTCMKINDMPQTKLFITDHADPSVGLFSQEWTIECPFEKDETTESFLEWFRLHMIGIYVEFSDGKVTAEYDFERINE